MAVRPIAPTLERTSNVTHVAHVLAPGPAPGALVFSTRPEQVPEPAHQLPAGVRFVTRLGAIADPGVMDWRGAMPRPGAARFAAVLAARSGRFPRVIRLRRVQPRFSHPDSPWTLRIRDIARRRGREVCRSPLLRVARVARPGRRSSRSTVAATPRERT